MRYQPGQRVTATLWGEKREGTVEQQRSEGIVWVKWDGKPCPTWQHAESLAPIQPA